MPVPEILVNMAQKLKAPSTALKGLPDQRYMVRAGALHIKLEASSRRSRRGSWCIFKVTLLRINNTLSINEIDLVLESAINETSRGKS